MIPEFIQAFGLPLLEVENKTLLAEAGKVCNKLYFIVSGSARLYFHYRRKQLTTQFFIEGDALTSVYSFVNQTPSTLYIETMEASRLLVMSEADYSNRLKQDKTFRDWFYHISMAIEFRHSNHLQNIMSLKADEKYRQLLQEQPKWLPRVSLRFLASYLGITTHGIDSAIQREARKNLR